MKILKYILILSVVFTSCKTTKNAIGKNVASKKTSTKKIIRKHINANFDKESVNAKFKVHYKNSTENIGFSVQLKIKKDEVIWLKGKKFITVFKAKITPTTVSYYSPYKKDYFEGDFSLLKKLLGIDINFNQLQNMLLGQAILDLKEKRHTSTILNNSYVLSPKKQASLFDIFYHINPSHFKLNKQTLINPSKNERLDISYPKYSLKNGDIFPQEIKLKATSPNAFTNITMVTKSVAFNTPLNISFQIPSGYKRIDF
ncbi:DUF4292 domain-containing protein [Tenacibaculum maritimum]|uniref:Probable lipoprotein n=1 Tax=Tenacibaculum maritimum NCIMB 2154 TaxID=1349785 RepID=A0A2H1EE37_9FLAO|nr:DUF4292 domain-containing protein [Tenacibaculum maritimum]MCD9562402.1 DUF4292 domain-containing protein [Tenacibaculum maritimum]MCD9565697.1 DUF4292 domain-containing protein [Tenacibaculum maritimum]MCD9579384.1 DUF4292 domain-containing protein [Tenacibaculum maritimum]MCD9586120.1 DUF4292 domain-containing protein [Tenacibaculum maritimum]MCD9596300.1 DUF4292 domain-containing protein [Tenacibaculum maritimum]